MDLQWAAAQAQAAEKKQWRDGHWEAGWTGGGPPTHNWPENKPDNFPASYPGADRGGPGNPYADLLPTSSNLVPAAFQFSIPAIQVNLKIYELYSSWYFIQ